MTEELVDIVNLKDEIIGSEPILTAHKLGRLHRLVEVWFYNKKGEVLLQQRHRLGPEKPQLLDFTVGGHVTSGQTYEDALFQEMREESGVEAALESFEFLTWYVPEKEDANDLFIHTRKIWAYYFDGNISDLRFDPKELVGFEWRDISLLIRDMKTSPENFVPFLPAPTSVELLLRIVELAKKRA